MDENNDIIEPGDALTLPIESNNDEDSDSDVSITIPQEETRRLIRRDAVMQRPPQQREQAGNSTLREYTSITRDPINKRKGDSSKKNLFPETKKKKKKITNGTGKKKKAKKTKKMKKTKKIKKKSKKVKK